MYHAALRANPCFISTYFIPYILRSRGEGGGPPPLFGRHQNGVVSFDLFCCLFLSPIITFVTFGCPVDTVGFRIDRRGPVVKASVRHVLLQSVTVVTVWGG